MLEVSNGGARAPGVFVFGFGPRSKSSIPLLGGTLLVSPVAEAIPFTLDRAGQYSLEIPVPADASLLGFNLNSQAGLYDVFATFSISLTNGVETWIL